MLLHFACRRGAADKENVGSTLSAGSVQQPSGVYYSRSLDDAMALLSGKDLSLQVS